VYLPGETVELYRDRYVPIDPSLTRRVEVPALSNYFDAYEFGAVCKAREVRLQQCNGQLESIESISGTEVKGDTDENR
jgi:hypothetical protein